MQSLNLKLLTSYIGQSKVGLNHSWYRGVVLVVVLGVVLGVQIMPLLTIIYSSVTVNITVYNVYTCQSNNCESVVNVFHYLPFLGSWTLVHFILVSPFTELIQDING